ncbi:DUF348 domain-containing protein [Candidatus Saccharibacteria bacterium]|nr:DUF348 domain-containing protein [Candidatus Saccharibacteria bacterium]
MQRFRRLSSKYQVIGYRKIMKVHPLKGHPFVIPVITFFGLFFLSGIAVIFLGAQTLGASDSRVVTVTIDGQKRTLPTRAKTVGDLLDRLHIDVDEQDLIQPKLDTPILEDDLDIVVQKARPVTIVDNGRLVTVVSAHQQPRKIIENAGIDLHKEDGVGASTDMSVDTTKDLILGEQVVIDRAMPASINLYGNNIEVRTRAKTVGELLDQKEIKTLDGDTIEPAVDTKLTADTQIFIVRMGKKVITSEEIIPAPIVNEDDPTLTLGQATVRQEGSDGKKLVTYEVELRNGQEINRKILQEVVATEPTKRVEVKGTKVLITGGRADWLAAVGINPAEYYAVDYIVGRESGWCPTKWQGEYGGCPEYHGTPSSASVGYGLCQATPGYKMSSAGADWATNPVTQLRWCSNYAVERYGSWSAAYNFWVVNHWW